MSERLGPRKTLRAFLLEFFWIIAAAWVFSILVIAFPPSQKLLESVALFAMRVGNTWAREEPLGPMGYVLMMIVLSLLFFGTGFGLVRLFHFLRARSR